MKFYLAQINSEVGDFEKNYRKILRELEKAQNDGCDLVIFPEMALVGYDARDLFLRDGFVKEAEKYLEKIIIATRDFDCAILIGCVEEVFLAAKKSLSNSVFLIEKGEIKQVISKKSLPNEGVFDEKRYFKASNILSYFKFRGKSLSVLICEDLWDAKNIYLAQEQIFDIAIIVNSSPFEIGKRQKRLEVAQKLAGSVKKPLIYLNQVGGQDSLVFDGASFVIDGDYSFYLKEFEEDNAIVEFGDDGLSFLKESTKSGDDFGSIYAACVLGLRDYVLKSGFEKVLLGMSGGIDSAVVAMIAVDALGPKNVALFALPSRFNSEASMNDALEVAKNLDVELQVISIEKNFEQMIETLRDHDISGLARQNIQSRIRGNILMGLSNSGAGLLLSTGNKSEMAVGYATIYGDMCGAFNPIKDLYKTQIYKMAKWRNGNFCKISSFKKIDLIGQNILEKEPTAELCENQKDSDSLGDYEILDEILFQLIEEANSVENIIKLGYDAVFVRKISKLLKNSEFKRQQSVLGVKISKMSFDRDRRYPIVSGFGF